MSEKELYETVKKYLETDGYYPVKKEPQIRIRGYKPDVTGLRGKQVQCVEVKLLFNEYEAMGAITQARVYQFGSTHSYVAFPKDEWNNQSIPLQNLVKRLCHDSKLGIYLIDGEAYGIEKVQPAELSPNLDLDDYNKVIQQLSGSEWIRLENTKPEYIRDICVFLNSRHEVSITRQQLWDFLREEFPKDKYWLLESGARRASIDKIVLNRIKSSVNAAIELDFIRVSEPDQDTREEQDKLQLSYSGVMLANTSTTSLNKDNPSPLDENTNTFLSAYIVKLPVIKMAIEELTNTTGTMLFSRSKCENVSCGHTHWQLKQFCNPSGQILCPKCGSKEVNIGLLHKLEMDYRPNEYYLPLLFTKALNIFSFPRVSGLDGIRLKQ